MVGEEAGQQAGLGRRTRGGDGEAATIWRVRRGRRHGGALGGVHGGVATRVGALGHAEAPLTVIGRKVLGR